MTVVGEAVALQRDPQPGVADVRVAASAVPQEEVRLRDETGRGVQGIGAQG